MPDIDDELEFTFEGENLTIAFDNDLKDTDCVPEPEEIEGFNCVQCKEFYQYAKANQSDGTFKCWGCRH